MNSESIEILFNDERLLAINKPPGVNVHDAPGTGASLLRQLREAGHGELTPVHRLDRDASGVLMLAKTKAAASALQEKWSEARKTYLALCEGAPNSPRGTIDAPILENQTGKPERLENALKYFRKANPDSVVPPLPAPKTSAVHPAGRAAQTDFSLLEKFERGGGPWSWLEISPRQGRMHQIRVHLAHAGYPLAIDHLYGKRQELCERELLGNTSDAVVLNRMPLHAAKLEVPYDGRSLILEAPLTVDLTRALALLRQA